MMIVITLSCCPPKLRGDLTRWLIEIDTGVYVGNLSARVRDAVWERIKLNIGSGRATMVYSANNEQKLEFQIYHAAWEPVDYDGIRLVRRNYPKSEDDAYRKRSKAAVRHMLHMQKYSGNRNNSEVRERYAVIDLETTGLQETDQIIEFGALIIENGEVSDTFSMLVNCEKSIPKEIVSMTGITQEMLSNDGKPEKEALEQFLAFIGKLELIGYNIDFDIAFLQRACRENGLPELTNQQTDVKQAARKKLKHCMKFSLAAVAAHLGIESEQRHRAAEDCMMTYRIFEKLKEM
ncbi:MAG TPA: type I-E CRISPR-associated endoribonuclease Cas2 [Ruminococcus sp.]|nr:type I-E CRISPR-associated endoribonuclease Cas2 [Ruminococcus sp.]